MRRDLGRDPPLLTQHPVPRSLDTLLCRLCEDQESIVTENNDLFWTPNKKLQTHRRTSEKRGTTLERKEDVVDREVDIKDRLTDTYILDGIKCPSYFVRTSVLRTGVKCLPYEIRVELLCPSTPKLRSLRLEG